MSAVVRTVPDAAGLAARFGVDGVIIYGIEGQDLNIVDIWPVHPSASALKLQVGFGVTGQVARTGKPVLLAEDSPRNALHRQLLGLEPTQTVTRLCLPLPGLSGESGPSVVGVLAMHRHPRRPFTDEDLDRAESYAAVLGLKIHADQLWGAVDRHRTERDRLIKQAISAQEAERRRIAFDLHDGVTTALASMAFHLSSADLSLSQLSATEPEGSPRREAFEKGRAELSTARDLADLAYNQTRAAISGLHSLVLDDLGLVAAIESLVQNSGGAEGPTIDLVVDPQASLEELPDHAAAALYRIAQETLSNAVEHAGAEHILLSLRRVGDSVVFGCTDDGAGFDQAEQRAARSGDAEGEQHFGLSSVAERCAMLEASLRIDSLPGRGTTVLVELPI